MSEGDDGRATSDSGRQVVGLEVRWNRGRESCCGWLWALGLLNQSIRPRETRDGLEAWPLLMLWVMGESSARGHDGRAREWP